MATVGRAATAKIREFNTQESTIPRCHYITSTWNVLFQAIGSQVVLKAPQFKAQEISNTLWAFAKLDVPNADEVFASLADAAIRLAYNNPSAYNPQNVSNALWAFAKAGRSHPQLYAALGPVGARIARNFSMQALANVYCSVLETTRRGVRTRRGAAPGTTGRRRDRVGRAIAMLHEHRSPGPTRRTTSSVLNYSTR